MIKTFKGVRFVLQDGAWCSEVPLPVGVAEVVGDLLHADGHSTQWAPCAEDPRWVWLHITGITPNEGHDA